MWLWLFVDYSVIKIDDQTLLHHDHHLAIVCTSKIAPEPVKTRLTMPPRGGHILATTCECRKLPHMQKSTPNHWLLTVLAACLLPTCTTQVSTTTPIQSFDAETANLANVTADVLGLAERFGRQNVLMVFDIDNTLLAMEQGLGADQWYDWQKGLANDDPCNLRNVGNRFAVQGALYFASAMRQTQADAAEQVEAVQAAGIPAIALTSRGQDYRLQTFRELRRNGYSFTWSAIGPPGGYDEPFIPVEDGRLSRYEDGVFLTAGQHKGEMLYALLQKTGVALPAVIVMVDDKQKNLDAVKETFGELDMPVHAWRYTGEDENVATFDPEKAHDQWQAIEQALRQVQQVLGPDNYDLTSATLPAECQK